MAEVDLESAVAEAIERATAAATLVPIQVERQTLREEGIDIDVLWVSSLRWKDQAAIPRAGDKPKADFNPFLPYEQTLFVADLTPTHVLLLNKFPVTPGHLLIVTRAFAEQTAPLDAADFDAVAALLSRRDGLVFFNGGPEAGASQRHKHLQLTPAQAVIEPVLPTRPVLSPQALPQLPFRHAFVSLAADALTDPEKLRARFEAACASCGVQARGGVMSPYNLLLTRRWLMVVPRTRECWEQGDVRLSINALGFAGSVLLRSADQFEVVKRAGALKMLASVTGGG